jgi:hypothetical protein
MSSKTTKIVSWSSLAETKSVALAQMAGDILGQSPTDADTTGYITTFMAQVGMPHSDPTKWKAHALKKNELYIRTNGDLEITIAPMGGEGHAFGSCPRYLMAWIQTEITRRKNQIDCTTIELGKNLVRFVEDKLKLQWGAGKRGNATHIKEQAYRLFTSQIAVRFKLETGTGRYKIHKSLGPITTEVELFENWKNPQQDSLWTSVLHLHPDFAKYTRNYGFPFDWRVVRAIGDSPLGIDLYWCLLRWWHYIETRGEGRSQHITWPTLMQWFGAGYAATPSGRFGFKKKALKQLRNIQTLTQGKLTFGPGDHGQEDGLWIHRSRHALILPE